MTLYGFELALRKQVLIDREEEEGCQLWKMGKGAAEKIKFIQAERKKAMDQEEAVLGRKYRI